MITIDLDPNIATMGPFTLAWHGVFTAVGIMVGVWLTYRLLKGSSISENDISSIALYAIIGGVIGARLFHVIDAWDYYSQNLIQIVKITEGGLSIYGAIVVGLFAAVVTMAINRIPIGRFLDAGAPGLVLGQAVGRIGDIINGEHHGLPTDWPIGVSYVNPNTLGEVGKSVHLAVGYEMVWDLITAGILLYFRKRLPSDGMVFALYTALYAFGRFFVTFTRVDNKVFLDLSQAQIIALILFVLSVPVMVWMATHPRHEQSAGAGAA